MKEIDYLENVHLLLRDAKKDYRSLVKSTLDTTTPNNTRLGYLERVVFAGRAIAGLLQLHTNDYYSYKEKFEELYVQELLADSDYGYKFLRTLNV